MSASDLIDKPTLTPPPPEPEVGEPRLLPALAIISHPLPERVGDRRLLAALSQGNPEEVSRDTEFVHPQEGTRRGLNDEYISRRKKLVFSLGPGKSVQLVAEEGSRVTLAGEPLTEPWEFSPEDLDAGVPLELAERVVLLLHWANDRVTEAVDALKMVGNSRALQAVRRDIQQVADTEVPVLIRGETGSGKELIARALHAASKRAKKEFVPVNMATLSKELGASALFGASKGAYTGAGESRDGHLHKARGGTLFLDEIGDTQPNVQTMLLRVLDTGDFHRVGGHQLEQANVRLVTATDANLESKIREGAFHEPLLRRLEKYVIRVPPLRERREDLGLLFNHLASKALTETEQTHRLKREVPPTRPWLPTSVASLLVRYRWPGNIRRLEAVVNQLVISNRGLEVLKLDPKLERELRDDLMPRPGRPVSQRKAMAVPPPAPAPAPTPPVRSERKLSDIPEQEILAALEVNEWKIQNAATQLGVPRPTLTDWYRKHPGLGGLSRRTDEEIRRCNAESGGDLNAMVKLLKTSPYAIKRRLNELGLLREVGPTGDDD